MNVKPKEINEALKQSTPLSPGDAEKITQEEQEMVLKADALSGYANVGMSKIDPMDILPPSVLLVQKSSDMSLMVDNENRVPKVGQYFHTGKQRIYDAFDAYIVFAGKSKYTDKRKTLTDGSHPVFDQYKAIGALKEDLSIFGINFRSTSLYALSALLTASRSQNKPYFAFNVHFETKKLSGEKGDWFVPVVRVGKVEEDPKILNRLLKLAIGFEKKADNIMTEEEDIPVRDISEENEGNNPGPMPF